MADRWYFAWDENRQGPFTATQLKALAEQGKLQPRDTVWKDGVEKGILAEQFQNLFLDPPAEVLPGTARSAAAEESGAADAASSDGTASTPRPPTPSPPKKKGRAVSARGAVLISQDGQMVQYRRKCLKCGHEDPNKTMMPIRNGVTRGSFFCPRCRKAGAVEIHCVM